ncbi:SusD/RagB family nutrient-binding outer membrane lipoprotein [Zunongwangia sp. HGR-M22]|uniref:SusD/RagB family nutrient-binding outer membrane lipoprotein n=1 Tax=Zunongwangia sp. HGR-M22 TaxID=3015168 RepID=UPI0022DE26C6|nr:SusD/RagB family nutrient-binding outer membrane lipoprotein [Zunongwangia sp. HGR-M22]WBL26177.1 SusD/RagB family nutrient-binding outer membrane lipoprotein [Zunongwangia sp. HGR-M22]
MKNKFIKVSTLIFAVSLAITSCDTVDFNDTNVNNNAPSNPTTSSLLTGAERAVSDYVGATTPNLYVQYISNGQYPEESQYGDLNWSFNGWYAILADLNGIIELNTNEDTAASAISGGSNANQIATATILRAYFIESMTLRWGRIPYSEALSGTDNIYPAYDSQEDIYMGLFEEIDYALSIIDDGNGPTGDFIFEGDMSKWRTFGNTLKMVMALRLSEANPTLGSSMFNEALGGAISSNDENLFYPYLADENNDNPWEDRFYAPNFRKDFAVSDTFVESLVGSGSISDPEDPRLYAMAEPANSAGDFIGAPYGQQNSAIDDYSFITADVINNQTAPLYIFTYSEVLFARSEAAALGWTTEDASDLYKEAIKASMSQWGISDDEADDYIADNSYNGRESIGYEKWVSLYLQGYEAWAEWRRMLAAGFEKELEAAPTLLSGATGIPNRQAYSATAGDLNEESYNEAISEQGPDDLNTKIWIFE